MRRRPTTSNELDTPNPDRDIGWRVSRRLDRAVDVRQPDVSRTDGRRQSDDRVHRRRGYRRSVGALPSVGDVRPGADGDRPRTRVGDSDRHRDETQRRRRQSLRGLAARLDDAAGRGCHPDRDGDGRLQHRGGRTVGCLCLHPVRARDDLAGVAGYRHRARRDGRLLWSQPATDLASDLPATSAVVRVCLASASVRDDLEGRGDRRGVRNQQRRWLAGSLLVPPGQHRGGTGLLGAVYRGRARYRVPHPESDSKTGVRLAAGLRHPFLFYSTTAVTWSSSRASTANPVTPTVARAGLGSGNSSA